MRSAALLGLALALGCASGDERRRPLDAAALDVGPVLDAALPLDASSEADADPSDAGPTDANASDVGPGDASASDAGPGDAGASDAGSDAGHVAAACLAALEGARFTFESGAQGWTHAVMDGATGSWPFNPWAVGTPSHGPPACAEGSGCFGTDLTRNYAQCGRAELRSPAVDLRACAGREVVIRWEHWYDLWAGDHGGASWSDGGVFELSRDGGATWEAPAGLETAGTVRINPRRTSTYQCVRPDAFYVHGRAGFIGSSTGWVSGEASLGGALDAPLRVRFAWASGVSSQTTNANTSRNATRPGWFIDHVRFELRE